MLSDRILHRGYAPPTAFYFSVKFYGFSDLESSFQEVSGLKVTVGTEEKKEGGDNDFVYHVPTPPRYDDLVLKRCLMPNSSLERWCRQALEDFRFDPKNIQVALLGPGKSGTGSQILASWFVERAFPISWELSTLNSSTNQLALETLTLKYRQFKREQ